MHAKFQPTIAQLDGFLQQLQPAMDQLKTENKSSDASNNAANQDKSSDGHNDHKNKKTYGYPEAVPLSLDYNSDAGLVLPGRDRSGMSVWSAADTSMHSHYGHVVPTS